MSNMPKHRLFRASILGIVIPVLGRYLVFGYSDPQEFALSLSVDHWILNQVLPLEVEHGS